MVAQVELMWLLWEQANQPTNIMADLIQLVKVQFHVDTFAFDQLKENDIIFKDAVEGYKFTVELDETLVESLSPDELLEFVGVDSEFLIHINILNWNYQWTIQLNSLSI